MRAIFLLGEERRDATDRPGHRVSRPRRKATAADIALRAEAPAEFVTSPDQGGRRRLLQRFLFANRQRGYASGHAAGLISRTSRVRLPGPQPYRRRRPYLVRLLRDQRRRQQLQDYLALAVVVLCILLGGAIAPPQP